MRAAVADAVDYLELDVRSSSDNMLYLMHDPLVDRTTDGTGAIALKTQDQISALHLDDGERVPTLAQVLTMAKPSGVEVLLELKAMGDGSSFRRLIYQVENFGADRVRIVSGSRRLLDKVSALAPGISQGIISRVLLTPAEVAPYDGVLMLVGAVTDAWLDAMPYPVWVWPSDAPTDWDWMASRVRGVITNHPVAFEQNRPVACPSSG
jgi:glycerophosphoryl diester phosphodiesterase